MVQQTGRIGRLLNGRAAAGACLVVLGVASCGPAGPRLYPVTGKVLVDGKPADGALVVFHPAGPSDKPVRPSAPVKSDGSFALSTRAPGDGAPAGDYQVAIVWLPPDWESKRDGEEVADRLGGRYADPGTSALRATVKEGPTELPPFLLPKKK